MESMYLEPWDLIRQSEHTLLANGRGALYAGVNSTSAAVGEVNDNEKQRSLDVP